MKELLQRWSELEPDKCRHVKYLEEFASFEVCIGKDWEHTWGCETDMSLAILQVAVQQALEARGWSYEQRCYGENKVGVIYPVKNNWIIRHESKNHAESLLKAYIEGLETLQIQGNANTSEYSS